MIYENMASLHTCTLAISETTFCSRNMLCLMWKHVHQSLVLGVSLSMMVPNTSSMFVNGSGKVRTTSLFSLTGNLWLIIKGNHY